MNIYLIIVIVAMTLTNVVKKAYTLKTNGNGIYMFGALTSLFAMLFFIVSSSTKQWEIGVLPYAIAFAVSYAVATIASVLAISYGSMALTTLIISFSLILPTVYGLIFLEETISFGFIIGIILLVVSLVLINKKTEGVKLSAKWIIYVFLAFMGNGMCSVIQKMQQVSYNGEYKNEFMIAALFFVTVFLSIFSLIKREKNTFTYMKVGWHLALGCGVMNGLVNLFVMVLSGEIPASILFPLISAGGIIAAYMVSKWFYKEILTKAQFLGLILGTMSAIFLSI